MNRYVSLISWICLVFPYIQVGGGVHAQVLHEYDAREEGQSPEIFRDGIGTSHWALRGCELARDVVSPGTLLTAAYRLTVAGTGVGGDTAPFPAGDKTFELWIRPGTLDGDHQVIFETGGGQNGTSLHITDSTVRLLNSQSDVRNFDLSVSLDGIDLGDFLHVVASLDQARGHIDLHVRGAGGGEVATGADGPVGRGGNRASLFSWGSGSGNLGGSHNNLGGRTEVAGVSPAADLGDTHPAVEALRSARSVFWTSASQYSAFSSWVEEDCQHACRYGKTYYALRELGIEVCAYPNVMEWRRIAEQE